MVVLLLSSDRFDLSLKVRRRTVTISVGVIGHWSSAESQTEKYTAGIIAAVVAGRG
jgi:hypothetical protein